LAFTLLKGTNGSKDKGAADLASSKNHVHKASGVFGLMYIVLVV
jgi:hypothetical protein